MSSSPNQTPKARLGCRVKSKQEEKKKTNKKNNWRYYLSHALVPRLLSEKLVTARIGKQKHCDANLSQGLSANPDSSQEAKSTLFLPAVLNSYHPPPSLPVSGRTQSFCPPFKRRACSGSQIGCKSPNLAASKSQKAPHHAFSTLPKQRALPSFDSVQVQTKCAGVCGGDGNVGGQRQTTTAPQEQRCWLRSQCVPSPGRFLCLVLWFPVVGISEI